jgi:NTE family protein
MKCKNILLLLFFILLSSYIPAQSVGLVLSGGGAKGLSHIGVIKALEENGIPIDYVSGTSIGAIVGGMYAIGLSPEEMIALIKSEEFGYWYKGEFERDYASYIYRGRSTPAMLSLNVAQSYKKDGTRNGLKLSLPTSIISPYPMDIAFMQLFSTSSAAANYDFNNLMIPFFCVSADILKKQAFVTDKGDLGSAIRASMTYPGYFKPISIDSTILFDGGFYNNFPWKLTKTKYNPDYIIGVKCVLGEASSP